MNDMQALLDAAVAYHGHLCAGQVLGVRLAMAGLEALNLDPETDRKRIVAIVEVDRCAADAVSVAAGVSLGKRTLKFRDYGKMAATFLDLDTGRAVRTSILDGARDLVADNAPAGLDAKDAQVIAYQRLPTERLVAVQEVRVRLAQTDVPGSARRSVVCSICGEKVVDGREVTVAGQARCRPCAGDSYYEVVAGAQVVDGGDA